LVKRLDNKSNQKLKLNFDLFGQQAKYTKLFMNWAPGIFAANHVVVGGILVKWCADNIAFVSGYDFRKYIFWNFEVMFIALRKLFAFIVNFFEGNPFAKVLLVNGAFLGSNFSDQGALTMIANIYAQFNKMFILKWVPGSLSNILYIVEYWRKVLYYSGYIKQHRGVKRPLGFVLLRGLKSFSWIPSLIFFLSGTSVYERGIAEAAGLRIPNIAILSAHSKVGDTLYPWRTTDTDVDAVRFYLQIFTITVNAGKHLTFIIQLLIYNISLVRAYNPAPYNKV